MPCIHTGNIASAAAGTILPQELWIANGTAVQLFRCCHGIQPCADDFLQSGDPMTVHVIRQTADQIRDDPIAVLHHCRGDLDVAASRQVSIPPMPLIGISFNSGQDAIS